MYLANLATLLKHLVRDETFYFFKKDFIYLREREHERERKREHEMGGGTEGEADSPLSREQTRDWIPGTPGS